jgi:hypothetical protein
MPTNAITMKCWSVEKFNFIIQPVIAAAEKAPTLHIACRPDKIGLLIRS